MAKGNLSVCLPITLAYEGGKADNPADPGGRTNEGITQRTYDGYRRGRGLATQDVYLITHDEVSDIYQRQYWSASGCEALPLGLDLCNFDGSVNSGLGRSKKWLAAAHGSIHAYCAARLTSMHSFGAWATFGRGWSARVAGIEAKAVVMSTAPAKAKPILVSTANAAATKAKVASTIAHRCGGHRGRCRGCRIPPYPRYRLGRPDACWRHLGCLPRFDLRRPRCGAVRGGCCAVARPHTSSLLRTVSRSVVRNGGALPSSRRNERDP